MEPLSSMQQRLSTQILFEPVIEAQSKTLIDKTPQMVRLLRMIAQTASFPATVLIYGETGVGKELVARAIHDQSERKNGLFVPVHLAATPESLIESELFGYQRVAFTGANENQAGLFECANGAGSF